MTVKKNVFLVNKKCLNEFALKAGIEKRMEKEKKMQNKKKDSNGFFHYHGLVIGSMWDLKAGRHYCCPRKCLSNLFNTNLDDLDSYLPKYF